MNDILEIELILNKRKYACIYNTLYVIIGIVLIIIFVLFTYKYQSYYITNGSMIDNKLELLVNIDDIKYISDNKTLVINKVNYNYKIAKIDEELYKDDNYNNYKYIYLDIDNLNNIDNYVYRIKIKKEYKTLVKYLKNMLIKEE